MNDNENLTELQPEPGRSPPRACSRFLRLRWLLTFGTLVLGFLATFLVWNWLKEPSRPPGLLAGDRQRMEAFLAAHDYEAFIRVMELQPSATRAELPPEWLRRYEEFKGTLLFTVREASTDAVINSSERYEAPLLSLRWSENGNYLVDVLAPPSKRKTFDGRTGRLVSVSEQPTLLPETDAHWPLGRWDKLETIPKCASDELAKRLSFSFGHNQAHWQAKNNQRPVLLMPSPDNTRMLTGFAVNPRDVELWRKNHTIDATGEPQWTNQEGNEQKVNSQKRCFNVWKANAFPP